MSKVITYSFEDNFIEKLASLLYEEFKKDDQSLGRIACVFGGRRPSLFLMRALSKKIKKSFIPPHIFSIDDFIDYLNFGDKTPPKLKDLDAAFLIYTLVAEHIPSLLKGRSNFSEFLPWAREIVAFIEQLDLEDISNDSLKHIEKSAQIGYDVPASINHLLQDIVILRDAYHSSLKNMGILSRGMRYLQASKQSVKESLKDFDSVFFCNFFYLHATEKALIKNIYDKAKAVCIFQGEPAQWSVLENNLKMLGAATKLNQKTPEFKAFFYQGFDMHSQVCITHHILKNNIKDKNKTVIVAPRAEAIIPLLTEISPSLDEFNVSMGYPLKRSTVYALVSSLARAQMSRRDSKYYAKDYLSLLKNPLIKNIRIEGDPAVTRIIVHKIEECLKGMEETSIGGRLFVSLDEIEEEQYIYTLCSQILKGMGIDVSAKKCRDILIELHELFLRRWEDINTFNGFSKAFERLFAALVEKSMVSNFPFNIKVIDKMYGINEELRNAAFSNEIFDHNQIWDIFENKLEGEMISFSGSPLKGLQILGLFETRSLNFEDVIIVDMNESIFPKLKFYEPLIPREVMLRLGLNRLEKEEEIQRYQFMRLASGAKNVHLIYAQNNINEKSRFIEEILWHQQKKNKKLDVVRTSQASFAIEVRPPVTCIKKDSKTIDFLKKQMYSASRINTYLGCPLQFYYKYVLGLKEKEDLLSTPQASCIGTFIHKLLEDTFKKFKGRKPVIDQKFKKYFKEMMQQRFEEELARRMRADSFLLKKIITERLDKFLDNEIERDVEQIICLEETRFGKLKLNGRIFDFTYTVDRIDRMKDASIAIIDYKTGGADISPKRFAALSSMEMTRKAIKDNIKSFQLPLYHYFILQDFPQADVSAQLYNIRNLQQLAFICEDDYPHREQIMDICLKALEAVFAELFNPKIPFEADKDENRCKFCPFISMCI